MMGQREARAGALAILGCLLGAVVIVLLAWAFPARGDTAADGGVAFGLLGAPTSEACR